jgi:hypothetical protein
MRRFVWTFVVLLSLPPTAFADCEGDVREAIAKLQTSGPFHYVAQEWNRYFLRQTAGRVIPGKAEHIESTVQNGSRGGQTIYVGKESWKNDGLGWVGPWSTSWTGDRVTPRADLKMVEGTCSAINASEGPRIKKEYRFSTSADSVVSFLIDVESGLIVRYEKLVGRDLGTSMISMYRHDVTIRIAPPVVDMGKRKANAHAAFDKEVEYADQHCRNTVIKLLQAGRDAPFKYRIEGGLWDGILSGMHGAFVPPHSLHMVLEGVPRHGGGSEGVWIGADAWAKTPLHDWRKTTNPSPFSGHEYPGDRAGAPPFLDLLVGTVSHVGRAECRSQADEAGAQIEYYEYDLYRDTTEGRLRRGTQRLYTGPDRSRPVKLETIGELGRVTQVQTRTYVPGLVIEPPITAAK